MNINIIRDSSSILFSATGTLITIFLGFIAILGYFGPIILRNLIRKIAKISLVPIFFILISTGLSCTLMALQGGILAWFIFCFILVLGLGIVVFLFFITKLILEWALDRSWLLSGTKTTN